MNKLLENKWLAIVVVVVLLLVGGYGVANLIFPEQTAVLTEILGTETDETADTTSVTDDVTVDVAEGTDEGETVTEEVVEELPPDLVLSVSKGVINVRAGAGTQFDVIGRVTRTDDVWLGKADGNGWSPVFLTPQDEEAYGYVAARFFVPKN